MEKARAGIEEVLHELEKTHQVFMVPWINRINEVLIVHGWPFILSIYRDGSLEDLIANPLAWSPQDRFASLIKIIRALRMAQERGIAAHQDLKPGNVFFEDLWTRNMPKDSKGVRFHMFVGDFGLADAFREFGRNSGSRPYMAPEQFSSSPMDPAVPVLFDIFALGVIAFEFFTDGQHPIGVATADVWPWQQGISQKWNREAPWRDWALKPDKSLPSSRIPLPFGISELILAALSPDPTARPSLTEFEDSLWEALRAHLALGYLAFTMRRTDAAEEEFQRALDLNPNFAAAHGYLGSALAFAGRSEQAIAHLEQAIRMSPQDPQNAIFNNGFAIANYLSGRFAEAVSFSRKALQQRDGWTGAHRIYVASLAQNGQIDEARAALARVKELQPDLSITWIEQNVPYTPGPMAKFVEGMRKAGLE